MPNHKDNFWKKVKKPLQYCFMPYYKQYKSIEVIQISKLTLVDIQNIIKKQIYSYFCQWRGKSRFTRAIALTIFHSEDLADVAQLLRFKSTAINTLNNQEMIKKALDQVREELKGQIKYQLDHADCFLNQHLINGKQKVIFDSDIQNSIQKCIIEGKTKRLQKDHSQKITSSSTPISEMNQQLCLSSSASEEKVENIENMHMIENMDILQSQSMQSHHSFSEFRKFRNQEQQQESFFGLLDLNMKNQENNSQQHVQFFLSENFWF